MLTYDPVPRMAELQANPRFHRFYWALTKANGEARTAGLYAEYASPGEFTSGAMEKRLRKVLALIDKLPAEVHALSALRARPEGVDDEWHSLFSPLAMQNIELLTLARIHVERSITAINKPEVIWQEWERVWERGLLPRDESWITEPGLCRLNREVLCLQMQRASMMLQTAGRLTDEAAEILKALPGAMLTPHTRRRRVWV